MTAPLISFLTNVRRMTFVYGMFALATTIVFLLAFFLIGIVRWIVAATPELLWRDGVIIISTACAATAIGLLLWRGSFMTWPIPRQAAVAIGPAIAIEILSKLTEEHQILQIRGENILSGILDSISLTSIGVGLLAIFAVAIWKVIPPLSSLSINFAHFHIDITARKDEAKD